MFACVEKYTLPRVEQRDTMFVCVEKYPLSRVEQRCIMFVCVERSMSSNSWAERHYVCVEQYPLWSLEIGHVYVSIVVSILACLHYLVPECDTHKLGHPCNPPSDWFIGPDCYCIFWKQNTNIMKALFTWYESNQQLYILCYVNDSFKANATNCY